MPVKKSQNANDTTCLLQLKKPIPIPCVTCSNSRINTKNQQLYIQSDLFLIVNNTNLQNQKQLKDLYKINNSSFLNVNDMLANKLCFNKKESSFEIDQGNNNTIKPLIIKKPFTNAEDETLLSLVKMYGPRKWQKISLLMKKLNFDRNGRQCRDRYFHYLDPSINIDQDWSSEEDSLLLDTVEKNGKRWKAMEKMFNGRTEVSLRNRYNLLIRKKVKESIQPKNSDIKNEIDENFIDKSSIQKNNDLDFNFEIYMEGFNEEEDFENNVGLNSDDIFDYQYF